MREMLLAMKHALEVNFGDFFDASAGAGAGTATANPSP
jgi:hypothetical protein